jgi:ssDNA-binding Zn-finger/Zn-ribbon topoisomerase 1
VKRILPSACPECGADMILRYTNKFLYGDGSPRKFYGCSQWPQCKATHGAHPDGRPLGIPADRVTKAARIRAHAAFDRFWQGDKRRSKKRARGSAYAWLMRAMGLTSWPHIGEFNAAQCEQVVRLCAERSPVPRFRYDAWEFLTVEVQA